MKSLIKRKLDDQAKVFSLASNEKNSSIFRMSITLNEKIKPKPLQKALELALEKYKVFKVKMQKGIFWHYFKENEKCPIVTEENKSWLKKINTKENNDYLFKVTYLRNKINIDFFHALTDGSGGSAFLKEIVYKYLQLMHPKELKIENKEEKFLCNIENAYKKSYKKNMKKCDTFQKAYMLKGEELQNGEVSISYFNIDLKQIKNYTKTKECSLSMYLVAMVAYSIYDTNYKMYKGKKPINICVPINLRNYFTSETISNFFSYMMINLKLKNYKLYTFDNILDIVKKEFEKKLKLEKILATLTSDVGMTNNVIVRVVPLFLKKIVVRLGALELKRQFTMTFSNVGKLEIDNKYSKYIQNYFVILAPDWAEKVKCGVCSYGENMVITFGTVLKDSIIENRFKELLEQHNIRFSLCQ